LRFNEGSVNAVYCISNALCEVCARSGEFLKCNYADHDDYCIADKYSHYLVGRLLFTFLNVFPSQILFRSSVTSDALMLISTTAATGDTIIA